MPVFVIAKDGRPLMPCSESKAKHLLNKGIAKVKCRTPFTIKMLVATKHCTQEVILGVDAGSKTIGMSASTKKERRTVFCKCESAERCSGFDIH